MPNRRKDPSDIYQSLGIEPVINCRGTFTIIGGSIELPQVVDAMRAASGHFVQYDELAQAVGRRLAEVTGAEWGLVSAGCAAGIKHVTAACVTGGDPEKLIRIPDLTGMERTQVIAPAYSRNVYDHAVRNVGVEMITVDDADQLIHAINPRTAMIYVNAGGASAPGQPLSLERIARIAAPRDIPILVDAAAEDLTIPNVHLGQGASVVAYSGGKALCGPQCAGLVLGRKDILQAAWQASSPHHGPGRDDKVGKEEIMGMLAAVEAWTTRDHAAEWDTWMARLEHIAARARQVPGVSTRVDRPQGLSNHSPVLRILWDPARLGLTGEQVAEDFARSRPRIALGTGREGGHTLIHITPSQMQPGEEEVVAERIYSVLSAEQPASRQEMVPPEVDVTGRWDVAMRYYAGTGRHQFLLEQDGNWVRGSHRGHFSTQEISGTLEGRKLTLRSRMSQPGDSILFVFSGEIDGDGDRVAGDVFLGEYLSATFEATRAARGFPHEAVAVPQGPPLAT